MKKFLSVAKIKASCASVSSWASKPMFISTMPSFVEKALTSGDFTTKKCSLLKVSTSFF